MMPLRHSLGLPRYARRCSVAVPRVPRALVGDLKPVSRALRKANTSVRHQATQALPAHESRDNTSTKPAWTPPTTGILSKIPPSWVPYAELSRINKRGGFYAFYMPYLIGLSYAVCVPGVVVSPATLVSTAGALAVYNVFLRGAACTANDIMDREYDRQVTRCKGRPMARGAVTPTQGWAWYAAQNVGAAVTIFAGLPNPTMALAYAVPIQLLFTVYPLGKRYTDFPQLVLSVPIAGGVLMGAASAGLDPFQLQSPEVAGALTALFMSHAAWITIFDYVNACQDTVDDIKAGVRSMAVRYMNTTAFISTLGAFQVGCLAVTGILSGFSSVFFAGAVGGNAILLAVMAKTVKRSRPDICAWWFSWGGLIVSGTTVASLWAGYVSA